MNACGGQNLMSGSFTIDLSNFFVIFIFMCVVCISMGTCVYTYM